MYFADIRGQQALADAQSANAAAHDIHLATAIWYTDNAIAWNDYVDVVVPLEANYYSAVQTAWVDFATARNDAHATKEIAVADAKAAAFRRWASEAAGGYFGIYAGYLADMEEASAARTQTYERATAGYLNAMAAADALWVETVLPAWVTYENEVSDHAVTWVDTSSRAWETAQNDIATAELTYTTAAVPVGTQLTVDLNENYSGWVNNVALADEAYGNELADHDVTWVADTTSAEESYENAITTHATTYAQAEARLNVLLTSAIGGANINGAGTVAGLITGTPFTPLASTVTWPLSLTSASDSASGAGANTGIVAYGAGDEPAGGTGKSGASETDDNTFVAPDLEEHRSTFEHNGHTYTMVRRYRVTYDDGGWWNFWQNTRIGDQLVEVFILDEGGTQVTISETDGRIRITPPDEVASRLLRERTQQIAAGAAAAVVILEGIVQVTVIASFFVPGPEDVVIEGVLATKLAQAGIKAFVNKSTGLIRYCFQQGDEVYEIGEASAKQILGNQADEVIGETYAKAKEILGKVPGEVPNRVYISDRNLQKVFGKHGSDFGLSGNWNLSRAADVRQAITSHLYSQSVQKIAGTYLGQKVIHVLDPSTGLNVILDESGNFIGGWKLGADQLKSVLNGGRLF